MTIETIDQSPPEHDPFDDPHRDALAETGFFGRQAAGVVLKARSTGRVLLMLRSVDVLQPFTWGNAGGAHHADEYPEDAARREAREETGWAGPDDDLKLVPALVFESGSFVYRNFVGYVPEEFEPILGWEATDHRWCDPCDPSDLPDPLHFGMAALFSDEFSLNVLRGIVTPERPLQPSTVARIAKGIKMHIDASAYANIEVGEPWSSPE